MISEDYGITPRPITKKNPQANAVLERAHQTLNNIIRTFQVQDNYLDQQDPWKGILAAAMFALRSTYHMALQATPTQVVFGRDAIMPTQFEANWQVIRAHKQELIRQNNQRENRSRIPHQYQIGDQVLLRVDDKAKFQRNPWEGPYEVTKVTNNGTARIRKGAVTELINIRQIKPYRH